MTTLQAVELGVLGPLQVRQGGAPVAVPGAKPRAILTMLGLHGGSVVSADTLVELLWGEDPPRTAAKALQTHISSLRRTLGDGFVLTQGAGWTLAESEVDASRYKSAARRGRDAATAGDTSQAVARFEEALALWRGVPELPDGRRGTSEKTRWIEGHAALVEDRLDALLATGRAAEVIGDLEAAVADAPLRERRWGQLMLALYRAGRQGEALSAYQRARSLLVDELGVDPGPELRRLEAAIVTQDASLDIPVAQNLPAMTRAVTFLLTDIEGSTAAWEADAGAMGVALARHDELVEQVVTSRGGRLIKTRGEGDATFSVFERPSAAAAAAIELQDAIVHEPWALAEPMRIRVALHTGEAELRDGDYFGRAVNRAARLRSLAEGGQILCSGATAEVVIDSLSDDVLLVDLGMRQLKNLARPEHVFELRLETADDQRAPVSPDEPLQRPSLPAVLAGPGPFVGRGRELAGLFSAWQTTLAGGTNAALIAGEPGVGKTRLAGEWSRQAYDQGALVIYGRCDEDLGAAYQPFAEALRSLVPCVGSKGLRGLRGVEALLALVPGLTDELPDLAAPTRADPDTERYALFDAVVALLGVASASAPVVLILDDLHWAAKPTLLLLRHLLRFGDQARVQIIGTYRSTDLDRSHPLAAMLADLHRDGTANRIQLSGLDEDDVTAYVAEAGYDDEELARALASVTGGNPFFLIEALRHVEESGGHWDPSTLPQGVREAVTRRLSRLTPETNKALGAAAVVGSRFSLELVERVVGDDLIDAFDEACKAGIVIEEPGGNYRFNHALVRQSLLAELASVRRMRLHQRIAATLETQPGTDDELLAELAYHYFECAWAGNAAKAVDYCTRAANQAMARLGYEAAADLYDRALHALEEIDDELSDRDDQVAELLVARCEALLAAGDVATAAGAVSQLQRATPGSARLAAWATCFDGELSMLVNPERLDEIEAALGTAAEKLAEMDDAAGEAKAHTVRASCLARLGRVGDCEIALDDALTAARRAGEHRRVNAVLAGAPLAALWGPNPVPRAGGRCLDVVRLLRITTDSPAVEATSTRCQAVLEAFRGRAEAARRMIDSARRTVTELGLRHALLEVEQFAGIVELVVDDPAAAEPHLRQAYNGFRRMGLDADTAETAALLGRACLALDQEAEADELCAESERLAGHALKPAMAWRMLRAQLLSRQAAHDEARRQAEAAVALAERTDALVDHGDACLALATVLGTAGKVAESRAAAERAVDLYERKGAAALADRARGILGARAVPPATASPEVLSAEPDNAAVRVGERVMAAVHRQDWDELELLFAPDASTESRRKVIGGFTHPSEPLRREIRRGLETGAVRMKHAMIAARGERLALARLVVGTADASPGAPQDEFLQLYSIDDEGRVTLQVWFDLEDIEAAIAELDAMHARFEEEAHRQARKLANAATQVSRRCLAHLAAGDQDAFAEMLADNFAMDDRRRVVGSGVLDGRDAAMASMRAIAELFTSNLTPTDIATRGRNLLLGRISLSGRNEGPEAFLTEILTVNEINDDDQLVAIIGFDLDDFDAAIAELDRRYLAGEAAPYADTWSIITEGYASLNRRELPTITSDLTSIDHRRGGSSFASGDLTAFLRATWEIAPDARIYVEAVHRLSDLGAVCSYAARGVSHEGFDAEWQGVNLLTVEGDLVNRLEIFDEADLDAAIARLDQLSRPTPRLENAASRLYERFKVCYAARDWRAITEMLADNIWSEDRRRVVNSGLRQGRDAMIAELSGLAETGIDLASEVVATRGARLVLNRIRTWGHAQGPDGFNSVALDVIEIDADERFVARIVFDLDDFDAAITELDARYLAGEAAPYSRTWKVITGVYVAHNRREIAAATPDAVSIDHRRGPTFAPGEGIEYIRAGWDRDQTLNLYIERAHRLNDVGAVFTFTGYGSSHEGFDAEWRGINLMTVDGEMLNRAEVFDEADLDAAIAKFDQLSRPAPRLENAASQAVEGYSAHFATRDWDALAKVLADDICVDDRRRVVNAGIRHGRDAEIANLRATVNAGFMSITSVTIAVRGERLILARAGGGDHPGEFLSDALGVAEINSDNQISAIVVFGLDDLDAAIAELDTRYLAGEAAACAHTWTVITRGFAALNRRELPATTPDWVNIDHRRGASFAPGEMFELLSAGWNRPSDLSHFIEAVHRLNDCGAVITHVSRETSQEGFDAEWRVRSLFTIDGDMVNRCEVFDEADLDTALAKFEELSRPARRLENTASQMGERFLAYFASGDWDAMANILADNVCNEDRRRVVGGEVRQGRDAQIADMRTTAELWTTSVTQTVIAIRGKNLNLMRNGFSSRGDAPEKFVSEVYTIGEIDADERIVSIVTFDVDDFDAAIAELDARYLAGEAAAHSHAWSVIAAGYASLNRHEVPPSAPDYVIIEHRLRATIEASDLAKNLGAAWDLTPDLKGYVEAVHRLSDVAAVVTYAADGTSQDGVHAEWRGVHFLTLDGGMVNRCELFDEANLDAALARFDELGRPALKNAASQAWERIDDYFTARDWTALAEITAENISVDDRRRVVNAGLIIGRDANIESTRALAEVGFTLKMLSVIATRGDRLALTRVRAAGRDPGAIANDALNIVEVDSDGRIAADVIFDLEDIDAAFAELDARYVAGEAADHAHAWSVIAKAYASLNRRELPRTTRDWVNIDHRRLGRLEPNALTASIRVTWDLIPDANMRPDSVLRLSNSGAVVTQATYGTSQQGFDAESHEISLFTVEDDKINRCEVFDETDVDAALARFDELHPQARRLENAASQATERILAHFAAADWDVAAEIFADEFVQDDRRRVLGAGVRRGRDAQIADMRAIAGVWSTNVAATPIATRGERLFLTRLHLSDRGEGPEAFVTELLGIAETNADGRIVAYLSFDPDDIDAAFEELDARYLAGEAAAHAHTWSLMAGTHAALNRHEIPAAAPDWVNIDHRRGVAFAPADLVPYARDTFNDVPDASFHIVAVHRLSDLGAVITQAIHGTSREGLAAEWQNIGLFTFEGDLANRCEIFDEADLEAALARFDELDRLPPPLENAATRTWACSIDAFNRRDMDDYFALMTTDGRLEDRRKGLRGLLDGPARRKAIHALFEEPPESWRLSMEPIAIRGSRLSLIRERCRDTDAPDQPITVEVLTVMEVDDDALICYTVSFDPDDIDAAFEELDARYLAGEAAACAKTWSVIAREIAAFNRHEPPTMTADPVYIDHRPLVSIEGVDVAAAERAAWDLTPNGRTCIEAVHRLSELGAVVTQVLRGSSPEGFYAEWRMISIFTVEGDLGSGYEVFDEPDVDAALARFEELQPQKRRQENAASEAVERFWSSFAARNWDALAETMADDVCTHDRRRVVNAGVVTGRAIHVTNMRAVADVGFEGLTSSVIATRGRRLVLIRVHSSVRDSPPGELAAEMLSVIGVNADNEIVAGVMFDADDLDAAFEELDARYLVGEAAPYARTWSVLARECAAFNRHEPGATTADPVYIDHRPLVSIEGVDMAAARGAMWDLTPDVRTCIEAVHRLTELGAVVTQVVKGTSPEGFDAEWQMISILTLEGDLISHFEVFDDDGLDAALARFEELHSPPRQLKNAATQAEQRFSIYFAARDWGAMADLLSDDFSMDDRRRVVNAGIRRGRDAEIASQRAIAGVGVTNWTSTVIAIRGERLVLGRYSIVDGWSGSKALCVSEVNGNDQLVAHVGFDPEDIDGAFEELDARYLAGEAAPYSQAWSVITRAYAALNRRELPPAKPDWVNVDHRRGIAFAPGDLTAFIRTAWERERDHRNRIETVHRVNHLGAVVTRVTSGTSQEGFEAEWRSIDLLTVDGDLIDRFEVFDETDLDAALTRFAELDRPAQPLDNAATQIWARLAEAFNRRDLGAYLAVSTADIGYEDRRKGLRDEFEGPSAQRKAVLAMFEASPSSVQMTAEPIAVRGSRLSLMHVCYRDTEYADRPITVEMMQIVEVSTSGLLQYSVSFDPNDIDAAFAEFDARYLAGEAAAYANAWSVISGGIAAVNRGEVPATTRDWVTVDHRRLPTFEASNLPAAMRAVWDRTPDTSFRIEAVNRLRSFGAVVTHTVEATSPEGFDVEWRMIEILTVEGDLLSRFELFDEADLDIALARFDELQRQTRRLENAASAKHARLTACVAANDWNGLSEILADDIAIDDRRRVVNSGITHGRDAAVANMGAVIDVGLTNVSSTVIATRGDRLDLCRTCVSGQDRPEAFQIEFLSVVEIDADERIAARVLFDPDDVDAAFAELDARYLAGEAAPYARTWSAMARTCAVFNQGELPATTPDPVFVDHRPGLTVDAVDLPSYLRVMWDVTPDIRVEIEAVHRLSELGAVLTHAVNETSPEGFNAEWRGILIYTLEADMVNRCEVFDEADLDAALARFDELDGSAP